MLVEIYIVFISLLPTVFMSVGHSVQTWLTRHFNYDLEDLFENRIAIKLHDNKFFVLLSLSTAR